MSIIKYKDETYDVKKMHTKQLVNLLRSISRGGFCECCYHPDVIKEYFERQDALRPGIKEELAIREHIPNKQEAKVIRKQKNVKRKNLKNKKYVNRR